MTIGDTPLLLVTVVLLVEHPKAVNLLLVKQLAFLCWSSDHWNVRTTLPSLQQFSILYNRVQGELVSSQYFRAAMDIYRQKYQTSTTNVLFVMASDDPKWCKKMFSNETDVVLTSSFKSKFSSLQPTFDMATLAQCHHSILRFIFDWLLQLVIVFIYFDYKPS